MQRENHPGMWGHLAPQSVWFYLVIVTKDEQDAAIPTLCAWLRTERRLGVPHWAVPPRSVQVSLSGAESRVPKPPERPGVGATTAGMPFLADDPDLPRPCDRELAHDDAAVELARLDENFVRGCKKCALHAQRNKTVFGIGHPRPTIVFVGEGPGADEDAQGIPFVGRAGQLLTRMIAAMTLTREQVYICNIVKCRPPGNRTPTEDESSTCSPYLYRQLAILRPRVIVALGRPATQTLLATKAPIGRLRGQFHDFPPPALAHYGLPAAALMPTFHPAYLLRSPGEKAKAWEDLQQVMRYLDIPIPSR